MFNSLILVTVTTPPLEGFFGRWNLFLTLFALIGPFSLASSNAIYKFAYYAY